MKQPTTPEGAVCALNRMFLADPEALQALCNIRVPCNEDLGNDPHCQVCPCDPEGYQVGILGILNGIFGANAAESRGYIAAEFDDATGRLTGFVELPE